MARASRKTQLVQERVGAPMDAMDRFQHSDEGRNSVVPLVLIPDDRIYCSCILQVPSGVYCVLHKWGDDVDEKQLAQPGLSCMPSWYRVAYAVTPQSCTYNAPVKSCPTADNVMVDCDLTMVFMIGPAPQDVKKFVYNLGASRFNEFLAAATEEGIRQLVRQTPHHKIYELRGGNLVRDMLEELNSKFKKFGVTFTKAAITDVQLGQELAKTLQATTEFESKINEQKKRHENMVKVIDYDAAQKMEELRKKNERALQDLAAHRKRALIAREKSEVNARNDQVVATTKAREQSSVAQTKAESEAHVASFQGQKAVEDMLATARSDAESRRIGVDRDCANAIFESEKAVEAAGNTAQALAIEADAEGKAADSLKIVREHKLEMAKLEVLESMSRNSKIVISGDNGDRLIGALCSPSILGDISLGSR